MKSNLIILGSDKFSICAILASIEIFDKNLIEVWTKENC
jgi:hypothetical protein